MTQVAVHQNETSPNLAGLELEVLDAKASNEIDMIVIPVDAECNDCLAVETLFDNYIALERDYKTLRSFCLTLKKQNDNLVLLNADLRNKQKLLCLSEG